MKIALCLGLSIVLLFAFTQPAASHEREIVDPECDHPLYWLGRVLYPVGHIMHHLICWSHGKHASQESPKIESAKPPAELKRREPKGEYSPRGKR